MRGVGVATSPTYRATTCKLQPYTLNPEYPKPENYPQTLNCNRLWHSCGTNLYMGGCQNYGPFWGTLKIGIIGTILGLYRENGKENGNYYIGVIYTLLVPFWVPEIVGAVLE